MTLTNDLSRWSFEMKCKKTVEALAKNGFTATYCQTCNEAAAYILREAQDARTVGFGGSMSVVDLGVQAVLAGQGKEILNHSLPNLSPEEKADMMRRALTADVYTAGTNAVTLSGELVNIDATGNRVAAMMFGPKKVIVVAGRNKIVDGDVTAAVSRIKTWASPPNARRLSFQTPCASTGFCSDCDSPQRICRAITVLERKPRMTDFHVLVVNEDMGF